MISIAAVTAARLNTGKVGDLFYPRDAGGERFVVGRLNGRFAMALHLDGQPQFYATELETMDGRRGLLLNGLDITVDLASAIRPGGEGADQLGVLFLDGANAFVLATTRNRSSHPVLLRGEGNEPGPDSVIFKRWSLVLREPEQAPVEMFTYSQADAVSPA